MKKLQLQKENLGGLPGYELRIKDREINIKEMLDELNSFFAQAGVERLWHNGGDSCYGCNRCCYEPLPVTSIDVYNLCQACNASIVDIYRCLYVEVKQGIIDVTLRRSKKEKCIFLNNKGKCQVYDKRPFLCQTYICCQTTAAVEEMRSQIVNQGMDELIRLSLAAFQGGDLPFPVDRGKRAEIDPVQWCSNVFTGKRSYSQLRLREVLSSDLWLGMVL